MKTEDSCQHIQLINSHCLGIDNFNSILYCFQNQDTIHCWSTHTRLTHLNMGNVIVQSWLGLSGKYLHQLKNNKFDPARALTKHKVCRKTHSDQILSFVKVCTSFTYSNDLFHWMINALSTRSHNNASQQKVVKQCFYFITCHMYSRLLL